MTHWSDEFIEIAKFHEDKQRKLGATRDGRPDQITGKVGWSIRDTCHALDLSARTVCDALRIAKQLKDNPKSKDLPKEEFISNKKDCLLRLLGSIRTTIVILAADKGLKYQKLAESLRKDLEAYERGYGEKLLRSNSNNGQAASNGLRSK